MNRVIVLAPIAFFVLAGAPPAKPSAKAAPKAPEAANTLEQLFGNEEILQAVPPPPRRLGEWVRYKFRDNTRTMEGFVRVALVPPATPPNGPFWLEISTGEGENVMARMKYLTRDLVLAPGHLQRALIDMKGMPPMDLTPDMLAQPLPDEAYPLRAKVKKAGKERVQVRAVTCDAVKLTLTAGKTRAQLWMCPDKVPIYGLVKAVDGVGVLELDAMGEGAVSEMATPDD